MRRDFEEMLAESVKRRALALSQTVEWWYRDRYRLPETDPRFLEATHDQMMVDMWADLYRRRRVSGEGGEDGVLEDPDFDLQAVIAEHRRKLANAGEAEQGWDEVDSWHESKDDP